MIDKYREAFEEEARELLAELESSLLELDQKRDDPELLARAFRALHTIKGSGAMFGFDDIAGFAHHLETAFDLLRNGEMAASADLINLALSAGDQIRTMLNAATGSGVASQSSTAAIVAELQRLTGLAESAPGIPATPPAPDMAADSGQSRDWRIAFAPGPAILRNGTNPLLLLRELRELGDLRLTLDTCAVPALAELDPERCYLAWEMELCTSVPVEGIRDVFIFVENDCHLEIEALGSSGDDDMAGPPRDIAPLPSVHSLPSALVKESTVRVPSGRLDHLVNLVGELVMNQSRIAQVAIQSGVTEMANPVQELERLVAELRDDVLGIRMLPIGSIFGRFTRLIHDLSKELGKEVDLITEGAATELDKSVLDQLAEPLIHILRNAIDHGIEPAEVRSAHGKPRRGTIRLTAAHAGSDVVIRISDDGRGIDRAAVRAKAIERQLIAADATLGDRETLNLLVTAGFSTARQVTSVSGRGVGLDVVRKQIDALRGSLALSSEPGRGCVVSLTLPLTLAIIDGLLVELGSDRFIIPMAAITENVDLLREERLRHNGRNLIAVRGELVPYIDLRKVFAVTDDSPAIGKIVVVRHEDGRVGLVVDRVLGTHQTVIQSLGRFFRSIDVVSGTTIMGDGRVALILDVPAVVRFASGTPCGSSAAGQSNGRICEELENWNPPQVLGQSSP